MLLGLLRTLERRVVNRAKDRIVRIFGSAIGTGFHNVIPFGLSNDYTSPTVSANQNNYRELTPSLIRRSQNVNQLRNHSIKFTPHRKPHWLINSADGFILHGLLPFGLVRSFFRQIERQPERYSGAVNVLSLNNAIRARTQIHTCRLVRRDFDLTRGGRPGRGGGRPARGRGGGDGGPRRT